eukprot:gb/GECH01014379.1/.p1 GENE.gb/GECH01014379.1/~~gb/GECH01014379.1/.p1  ORF type:complete len:369 (+),score=106.74 gb/GECH01014379.1/:1-1107(+)
MIRNSTYRQNSSSHIISNQWNSVQTLQLKNNINRHNYSFSLNYKNNNTCRTFFTSNQISSIFHNRNHKLFNNSLKVSHELKNSSHLNKPQFSTKTQNQNQNQIKDENQGISFSNAGYGRGLSVNLKEGNEIKTQSARTVAYSEGIKVWRTLDGNPVSAILRYLTGGPGILEKVRAIKGDGFALIAPFAFDVKVINVTTETQLDLIRGSFVAATSSLKMSTKRQPLKLVSDIGLFTWGIEGNGQVAITAIGKIHEIPLAPKETMVLSRRHMVAWDASVSYHPGPQATRIIDFLNPKIVFDPEKRNQATMNFTAEPQSMVQVEGPGRIFVTAHHEPKLGFWKRFRNRSQEVREVEGQLSSHDTEKKKKDK